MLVFRIEIKHLEDKYFPHIGRGCYNGSLPAEAPHPRLYIVLQDGIYGDLEGQPLVSEDIILLDKRTVKFVDRHTIRFAFNSVDSYHQWFKSAKGRLDAVPWGNLQVYRVPAEDVIVGTSQCLVVASSMVPIETLPLDYEECVK